MYYQDSDFEIEDRAVALAKKKAVTPAQIGIAWILNKPSAVAPIFGDKKMHHLEQASDSLTVKLSDEDMHHLEERYQPHKILGHT
jgi:aryl-alcohol dehydrogenase-like predicted oxidoreductase